jgi:hypothetical protein
MPRICTICSHPQRSEIDAALVRPDSLRAIAKRFETSAAALHRHRSSCISEQLSKAKEFSDIAGASTLVKELREITKKTGAILARAVRQKQSDIALKAIARLERQLELKGRLLGQLEERDGAGAGAPVKVLVQYVDRQVNLASGTHNFPQSLSDRSANELKALEQSTCDPLLSHQNRESAETKTGKNVLNAPGRAGAAEGL